jgi:hypothetical protein
MQPQLFSEDDSRWAWAEESIQRKVIQEIRRRGVPDLVYFHPPNGGWRHPHAASRFKTLGALAGVSDIVALLYGRFYALELKAPGGKMSPAQHDFQRRVKRAGGTAECCDGLASAIALIERWGWLFPETQPPTPPSQDQTLFT